MHALVSRILVVLVVSLTLGGGQAHAQSAQQPVILTIDGAIATRNGATDVRFDATMLDALPAYSIRTWTPWFKEAVTFSGPRLQDVLEAVAAKGKTLHMVALNDYAVDVPFDDAAGFGPLLARRIDGKVIGVREKGPLFLVYPFDDRPETRNEVFYARSIWQLTRITVR